MTKKVLNLFNDLFIIILTDETLESESQENENENLKVESRKEENENENEYENEDDENEDNDNDETIDQNKLKDSNDNLDEIVDKSKSFEEQRKLLKKGEDLKGYWPYKDFGDKKLKFKYFKIKLAECQMKLTKSYLKQYLVIHL